jgi:hypothetical protein
MADFPPSIRVYKPDEKPAAPAPSSAPARYVPQTLDDDAIPFMAEFR